MPKRKAKYTVVLLGRHPISKLFHISQESRFVAFRFYRVQLPCRYRWRRVEENGTFYFNPELDIVKLDPEADLSDQYRHLNVASKYLAEFAHQLRLKDPRRVGLVNLALESLYPAKINWEAHLAQKSTVLLLREAIQRLKCVYFISCAPLWPTWCRRVSQLVAAKSAYPRVQPVMVYMSAFDRLPYDPRPLDLRAVYMGTHSPRKQVQGWLRMLARLQVIDPSHKVDYRCMVAREATRLPVINNRDTALEWVEETDKMLVARKGNDFRDLHQESRTAFGFWLFPIECLEPNLDIDRHPSHPERYWQSERVVDLSSLKPELCLFHI